MPPSVAGRKPERSSSSRSKTSCSPSGASGDVLVLEREVGLVGRKHLCRPGLRREWLRHAALELLLRMGVSVLVDGEPIRHVGAGLPAHLRSDRRVLAGSDRRRQKCKLAGLEIPRDIRRRRLRGDRVLVRHRDLHAVAVEVLVARVRGLRAAARLHPEAHRPLEPEHAVHLVRRRIVQRHVRGVQEALRARRDSQVQTREQADRDVRLARELGPRPLDAFTSVA